MDSPLSLEERRRFRELYNAAWEAREYVRYGHRFPPRLRFTRERLQQRAPEVLERLDAALTDAGEVLE